MKTTVYNTQQLGFVQSTSKIDTGIFFLEQSLYDEYNQPGYENVSWFV